MNQCKHMYNSLCMFTVLWVNDIENKTHLYTHTHMNIHTHIQKYILNKSPSFSWGRLGSGGKGICFNLGELKKKNEKRKPSVFLKQMLLSWSWSCISLYRKNLSNNNNKLLELGLKRFRCTFFIEIYSKNCRFNSETRESIFLFSLLFF